MNQLQIFKNEMFEVGVVLEDGQVLFDAEQVARSLGFTTVAKSGNVTVRWSRVNSYLPSDYPEVGKGHLIPEPMVYKLAFKASNEVAEQFQDWLAIEVIPSIRKHGAYMTSNTIDNIISDPDFGIKLLTELKGERELRVAAETKIQEEKKYTDFGKVVSLSDGAINVGAFAKIMYDKHGVNIGRNKLMAWLRDNGYLIKQGREKNFPKQHYIERGWFRLAPAIIKRTEGDVQGGTSLITGKGQVELSEILIAEFSGLEV